MAGSLLPGVAGVAPYQSCARENHVISHTVYCSKFNSPGIVGCILHKTISKHKAKMMGLVSLQGSCSFAFVILSNCFSFCISLLETHSRAGSTRFVLKSWDSPRKKYINISIFLNLLWTVPNCQSVCVTCSLIIFFHLSWCLHSPQNCTQPEITSDFAPGRGKAKSTGILSSEGLLYIDYQPGPLCWFCSANVRKQNGGNTGLRRDIVWERNRASNCT